MDYPQIEIQNLFTYGLDIYDRRVYLIGEITQDSAANAIKCINLLSRIPEPIELWVNSYGGDLTATFALYDTIQSTSCTSIPIHTIGTGEVLSAALLILACGFTRSGTSNLYAMAHSPTADVPEGDTHIVVAGAAAMAGAGERMWALLAKHSDITASEWKDKAKDKGEVWMTAASLKKAGVIDDIITPISRPRRKKVEAKQQKKQGQKAPAARKR